MPQHDSEFGHNEIHFEDKKDAEVLRLRAQKDVRLHAQNNAYKKIENNQQIHIKNNENITIGGNQTEFVKRSKVETIAVAKALSVGGAYQISVGAAKNESVGLSSSEQVGHTKFVVVGKQYVMKTGDSYIEMNSNGNIIIKGNDIQINAQTQISLKAKAVALNSAPPLAPNPPEIPAILPVAAAVAPIIHAFSQKNEVGETDKFVVDITLDDDNDSSIDLFEDTIIYVRAFTNLDTGTGIKVLLHLKDKNDAILHSDEKAYSIIGEEIEQKYDLESILKDNNIASKDVTKIEGEIIWKKI